MERGLYRWQNSRGKCFLIQRIAKFRKKLVVCFQILDGDFDHRVEYVTGFHGAEMATFWDQKIHHRIRRAIVESIKRFGTLHEKTVTPAMIKSLNHSSTTPAGVYNALIMLRQRAGLE